MDVVGKRMESGEMFIPEVFMGARAGRIQSNPFLPWIDCTCYWLSSAVESPSSLSSRTCFNTFRAVLAAGTPP
ncbi:MAG: hypothetical protein JEZ12_22770 [Desulfobacterium sp.]|nr:hypothetical protein [Desulfobacterium sp.]